MAAPDDSPYKVEVPADLLSNLRITQEKNACMPSEVASVMQSDAATVTVDGLEQGIVAEGMSPNTVQYETADMPFDLASHQDVFNLGTATAAKKQSPSASKSEAAEGPSEKTSKDEVMTTEEAVTKKPFEFMKYPRELRNEILEMLAPDCIEIVDRLFISAGDPTFVPTLAQLSNGQLRLECLLATLKISMLKISGRNAMLRLLAWLESLDLSPLNTDPSSPLRLQDGFDAVRSLHFTDQRRAGAMLAMNLDNRHDHPYLSGARPEIPTTWVDDLAFARMCKDLRTVEVELYLSNYTLQSLHRARDIAAVDEWASYQIEVPRLLELEGLKVLRIHVFNARWGHNINAEDERKIVRWLQKEFQKLNQAVVVKSEFEWYDDEFACDS